MKKQPRGDEVGCAGSSQDVSMAEAAFFFTADGSVRFRFSHQASACFHPKWSNLRGIAGLAAAAAALCTTFVVVIAGLRAIAATGSKDPA